MVLILLLILLTTIVFYLIKNHYAYWEKRGVPGPKPTFIIGNMGAALLMKKSAAEVFADIYNEYKKYPFVGMFRASSPTVIICDPELIKEVSVKSFHHFHDNDIEVDKELDPILGRNPFFLKSEEWKAVRSQLTPGFTSGKMKSLYPNLQENSRQLVKFIENQPKALNGEGYEAKELCSRFTLNNVATCAFGINGKCFEDDNSEFRQLAKNFLTPGSLQIFVFMIITLFPFLGKLIKIKFVNKRVEDKLTEMIKSTLKFREENNIEQNDYLHFLQQLKKTCTAFKFTDVDVTAHAAGFFIDGFETSAIVMSFLIFELALKPEVQKKLRAEVNRAFQENDGQLPYDVLQNLSYLDGVLYELLRKRPPGLASQKICTKSYTYTPKPGDGITKPVTIEKGTGIIIPLYGLHNDPRYFKDPEDFDPERFIGVNKENVTKYTFLPYGEGPRACLGQRFGALQIKVGIAYLIRDFELSINTKTQLPMKYDPYAFLAGPVGGFWIDFKKITQ